MNAALQFSSSLNGAILIVTIAYAVVSSLLSFRDIEGELRHLIAAVRAQPMIGFCVVKGRGVHERLSNYG